EPPAPIAPVALAAPAAAAAPAAPTAPVVMTPAIAPPPTFGPPTAAGNGEPLAPPAPVPPGREPAARGERQEMARVDADLLDRLLNYSGEVSIGRARLEQQIASI